MLGWFTKTVMGAAGADAGANGVGQCGMSGTVTIALALGRSESSGETLGQGLGACGLSWLGERVFQ